MWLFSFASLCGLLVAFVDVLCLVVVASCYLSAIVVVMHLIVTRFYEVLTVIHLVVVVMWLFLVVIHLFLITVYLFVSFCSCSLFLIVSLY